MQYKVHQVLLFPESASFLSGIYLSYENNYTEAAQYSEYLYKLYPENLQYMAGYIKNLLLLKKYEEAELMMNTCSDDSCNSFFNSQTEIFSGILQEKKYHNLAQAKQYYEKGLENIKRFGDFGNEYIAYSFFGLSRIAVMNDHRAESIKLRKKALDLAVFKNVSFDD